MCSWERYDMTPYLDMDSWIKKSVSRLQLLQWLTLGAKISPWNEIFCQCEEFRGAFQFVKVWIFRHSRSIMRPALAIRLFASVAHLHQMCMSQQLTTTTTTSTSVMTTTTTIEASPPKVKVYTFPEKFDNIITSCFVSGTYSRPSSASR